MPNVLAADATGAKSLLTDAVKAAINSGLANMSATVSDVILIVVPVTISIIALTAGVKYALKKVKSVISQAA